MGKPGFELADDEIEYGVRDPRRTWLSPGKVRKPSKELAKELVDKILADYEQTPKKLVS